MPEEVDVFDRKILGVLQADCSKPTTEIAEEVGLSQSPCWRRIQRLRDVGLIRAEVALLDRRKLGLNMEAFAHVKVTAHGRANLEEFAAAVRSFDEVLECFVLLGSVDFMLRIVTNDIESYERFFFDKLAPLPGIQEINTMVIVSDIKSTTALPINIVR